MKIDETNSSKQVLELEELLLNIEKYKWEYSVFLPENKEWKLKTKCYICNLDELEEEELPEYAVLNNFIEVLSVAELQDIVLNLNEQINSPSLTELYKAFMYYYKNDSFIVIKKKLTKNFLLYLIYRLYNKALRFINRIECY